MERKKIELRNASAMIGNSGSFGSNKNATSNSNANNTTSAKDSKAAAVAVPNNPGVTSGAGQRKGG